MQLTGGRLRCPLRRVAVRTCWILTAAALLLLLFIVLTPQGRTAFHTALFVTQTLDVPVKPQSWFTDEPVRHEIVYGPADGDEVADVYRLPDGRPRAGVVLSLGAVPTGLEDPRVVNLGNALARAGYVAMFHWSPNIGLDADVHPSEPRKLVRAFEYLAGQDYVDPERVGLGGFSIGASFALVAAADPRIRDRVSFVNAFGPYFDAEALVLQAASRSVLYGGERIAWEPHPLTQLVLATELIQTLDDPSEAALLTRHYIEDQPASPAELDALSSSALTLIRLMDGVEPGEAEELYAMLPADFREELARISPSNHIDDVRARLLVMHDRYDPMVPVAESRRLVEATRERSDVSYTEFVAFDHTTPGEGGLFTTLGQAARLYRHMYAIVRTAA
ncbi:MAG: hypothetical protein OXL97_01045 [Chloroflexota bacterium]|nr:hypothetical protein [Chloroflexota bacterium]MDE2884320.1 hypothetical protein [Chloroflexota bacterium]